MIKKFLFGVGLILIFYMISAYALAVFAELDAQGLFAAGLLATINIIAAYGIIAYAFRHEQKKFAKIFLSGLVIRLFILLSVIFLILKFTTVNHFVFISSLFILYFIYQIWEVTFLNKNITNN